MASSNTKDERRLKATALMGLAVEENAGHQPADISDEQLAAFIDNGLPEEESALVQAALAADRDLFERWQDLAEELNATALQKAPVIGQGARGSTQTPPSIMQRAIEWLQAHWLLGGGAGAALASLLFVFIVVDPSQQSVEPNLNLAQLSAQLDQRYAQLNSAGVTSQKLGSLPDWTAPASDELVAMGASLDDVVFNAFNAGVKTGLDSLQVEGELKARYDTVSTDKNCFGLKRTDDCVALFDAASYTGRWAISVQALCSDNVNNGEWPSDKTMLQSLVILLEKQAPKARLTEFMQGRVEGAGSGVAICQISRQLFELASQP